MPFVGNDVLLASAAILADSSLNLFIAGGAGALSSGPDAAAVASTDDKLLNGFSS